MNTQTRHTLTFESRGRVLAWFFCFPALLLMSLFPGSNYRVIHASMSTPAISAGVYYRIVNRNSSLVVNIPGGSRANAAHVDQENDMSANYQQWQFVAVSGYYKIVNHNSGKVLEVVGNSSASGATIDQGTDSNANNQQWQLVSAGNAYKFVNHNSHKVLEVANNSLATGANLDQNNDLSSTNQQWLLFQVGQPIFPPGITPLITVGIRDTYIMRGPDGIYYMTGTQANAWNNGIGIQLWSSSDLKTWTSLGYIWTFTQGQKDGCWCSQFFPYEGASLRVIWAPELHYLDGTYFIPFSMPGGGTGILRSISGKITGPYKSITNTYIAARHIDASLFQDDNGSIYYLDKGRIALMKSDMSGLAEPLRTTGVTQEGVEMIKHNGVYELASADFSGLGYYNSEVQRATNIYGPYTGAYEAVPWAGHGNYFYDSKGQLWCTMFGNSTSAPVYHEPAIVPAKFGPDNLIRVDLKHVHSAELFILTFSVQERVRILQSR